ncbi:MAG: phosphoribosylformimino-5-aminoimidazole carboxamide ribotide isomerase, partial [Lachnospiraceae bacterium]|nr:phosphoribosylformimino-5-aminoimidazole carboxamide ribotide isomerase [Lachnospiraceae bacterium]
MKFRPCIDIHNGSVKQIVGMSLRDEGDHAAENFVASKSAAWYASLFRNDGLTGGHVILLNGKNSPMYGATEAQAKEALRAWPGGLEVGGGITAESAGSWIDAGASHVIVTSYVFRGGEIRYDRMRELVDAVGREHIVLDLSCRRREDSPGAPYYVCTDRWQYVTDTVLDGRLLETLSSFCDEFLIHGIAVEGKGSGIDTDLAKLLGSTETPRPITYAGGIRNAGDIELIGRLGNGKLDYTVGSALDIYGGNLPYRSL